MARPLPARKTIKLSDSLQRRLNTYASAASAAGVSVLALAGASEAKVVYTPTHQGMLPRLPLYIDLNHDGIRDFALRSSYYIGSSSFKAALNASSADHGVKNAIAGRRMGSGYFLSVASALAAGDHIGPRRQFPVHRPVLAQELFSKGRSSQYSDSGPWAGKGKGVTNRYLGLKFVVDGKVHYGWARISVSIAHHREYNDVNATLTGYAYETTPNKAILAGDTGAANAPSVQHDPAASVLGSLALGQK
jgi:hypothetical protein